MRSVPPQELIFSQALRVMSPVEGCRHRKLGLQPDQAIPVVDPL